MGTRPRSIVSDVRQDLSDHGQRLGDGSKTEIQDGEGVVEVGL
jgi:hypothetical protein